VGTDIHVWLAARDSPEAEWNLVLEDMYGSEIYNDRNYSFFGALAGIRHPMRNVTPIVTTDGLPKNSSSLLIAFDKEHRYGHTLMNCSFEQWYQAIDLMWKYYYTDSEEDRLYNIEECSEYKALETMKLYMEEYVAKIEASLSEELKIFFNPEARIIFWFDS